MTARIDARPDECRHGMLAGQCAPCKGATLPGEVDEPTRLDRQEPARWIYAAHPSRCAVCGGHIWPGDLITRATSGWLGECCSEAAET